MNAGILPRCFGEGCDARIAGRDTTANPYWTGAQSDAWLQGWRHVNHSWGTGIKRRWPCRPLPLVKGGLAC